MKKKIFSRFTIILFLIGLMTAIQYNTVNEPDSRDTRDVWEIRQELSREKQFHSELLSEISMLDATLAKYDAASSDSPEQALKETVERLREQAGLEPINGPGIEVSIEPSQEAIAFGYSIDAISPNLLIRFVNEINQFNGLHISIDGKRMINTTAIRDINGNTAVNARPVQTPPFDIHIVTESMEDAEKLYNHLLASPLLDEFFIDNMSVVVSEPEADILVESYEKEIDHQLLETMKEE